MPKFVSQREKSSSTTRTLGTVAYLEQQPGLRDIVEGAIDNYLQSVPEGEQVTLACFKAIGKDRLHALAETESIRRKKPINKMIDLIKQHIGLWVPIILAQKFGPENIYTFRNEKDLINANRLVPDFWKPELYWVSSFTPHRRILKYRAMKFSFENKFYEIRVWQQHDAYHVRAYFNKKPANGYEYVVHALTAFAFKNRHGYHPVDDLIVSAKEDIINKTWEKYLSVLKEKEVTLSNFVEYLRSLNEEDQQKEIDGKIAETFHEILHDDLVNSLTADMNATGWGCDTYDVVRSDISDRECSVEISFIVTGDQDPDKGHLGNSISGSAIATIDEDGKVDYKVTSAEIDYD
ncbi:hypothetical protein JXQ70_17175 [bacterium]|nr:hypothetical protein [bacterium]